MLTVKVNWLGEISSEEYSRLTPAERSELLYGRAILDHQAPPASCMDSAVHTNGFIQHPDGRVVPK